MQYLSQTRAFKSPQWAAIGVKAFGYGLSALRLQDTCCVRRSAGQDSFAEDADFLATEAPSREDSLERTFSEQDLSQQTSLPSSEEAGQSVADLLSGGPLFRQACLQLDRAGAGSHITDCLCLAELQRKYAVVPIQGAMTPKPAGHASLRGTSFDLFAVRVLAFGSALAAFLLQRLQNLLTKAVLCTACCFS